MTRAVKPVYKKAKDLDADINHLHDPESISIGLKLKKLGKKIIYDVQENLPKQLLSKLYLTKFLRIILFKIFEYFEKWVLPKINFVIAATPFIRDKILEDCECIINCAIIVLKLRKILLFSNNGSVLT